MNATATRIAAAALTAAAFLSPLPLPVGPAPALAQEEGEQPEEESIDEYTLVVTEADYATHQKLQYAQLLAQTRKSYSGNDKAIEAKAEAEWKATFAASGWSRPKLDAVRSVLMNIAQYLQQVEEGGEEAANAKESLASYSEKTVALVRTHQKQIFNAHQEMSAKADAEVRAEKAAAKRGALLTEATLAGTWILDADATLAGIVGPLKPGSAEYEDIKAKMKDALKPTTYTFSPGGKVETRTGEKGAEKVETGSWRIEGEELFLKNERGRERGMKAGIKDGKLQLFAFGVATVFKKQG